MRCQMKKETELTVKQNWQRQIGRVRAGPRNKPTQKERDEHEAQYGEGRQTSEHHEQRCIEKWSRGTLDTIEGVAGKAEVTTEDAVKGDKESRMGTSRTR